MDLGIIETYLQTALKRAIAGDIAILEGPPVMGPATGLRAEVFVHASFADLGGVTPDGARVARHPASAPPDYIGFAEERPARIVVEITCVCASHRQSQQLCALVSPPVLVALETMADPVLAALDAGVSLRFAEFVSLLHAADTTRQVHESAACHHGRLTFHLNGFLHIRVAARGGLRKTPSAVPTMRVEFDPEGIDLPREHVVLRNETTGTIDLGGWVIQDAATRTHRFVFPEFSLAPGALVRVWTGRGVHDGENLYWDRRQAVWNNAGDAAVLLALNGAEVARYVCVPPKASKKRVPRRKAIVPATAVRSPRKRSKKR